MYYSYFNSDNIQTLSRFSAFLANAFSANNKITIWNTNDGTLKHTLEGHTAQVKSMCVLSDGRLVSGTSSPENVIKIWHFNSD